MVLKCPENTPNLYAHLFKQLSWSFRCFQCELRHVNYCHVNYILLLMSDKCAQMPTDNDFHYCETYSASVLSYTDNNVSNTVLDSLKSVSHILKTDPRVKLKNEIYFDTNVYVSRSVRLLFI